MPIEHPPPTEATVKLLYAHAFGCAFESCPRPLYRLDNETGVRTLNSRVCHINARREYGPRWDPNQSADENRSEQNLILMCVEHAAVIDIPETLSTYPTERLRDWKQRQLAEHQRIQQGWILDTDMAREAIQASLSRPDVIVSHSTVELGGKGGNASGAGGGGGGAIGRGARGGRGGDGGDHRVDHGEYTVPRPDDAPRLDVKELARLGLDYVPGAGGAGARAMGNNARGGDGGSGGEHVSAAVDLAALRKDGFHHIEYVVGKGGKARCDGEDSVVNFVTEDGRVLKTIRASGGRGGGAVLPDGVVEVSPEDIQDHFRVTTIMIVNAAEIRDGLFFLLGADWERYTARDLPSEVTWTIVCTARWAPREWSAPRGLSLSLLGPDGQGAFRQTLVIPADAGPKGGFRWAIQIRATLHIAGIWTVRLHSGKFLLANTDISVTVLRPDQSNL
jgi:hypothetical protein